MDVPDMLQVARADATAGLAGPGDWLSGRQRLAVWAEARDARTNPLDEARRLALTPEAVAGTHAANPDLSAPMVDLVHRLTTDPGRLRASWAQDLIAEIGEERYTEIVAVTAICSVIDSFDRSMGAALRSLPTARPGEPRRVRPQGVGDVGAWVAQATEKARANVGRALTLVPETHAVWRPLVDSHYSRGADFLSLRWQRALSRPQVELVAARTTALNECFY